MSVLIPSEQTDNKTIFLDMDNDEYDSLPEEWPVRTHMLAGAAAGILEHATMYPIDCVKTQMQSIEKVRYNSVYNALSTIYMKEGYRRLLRGMSAMVFGAGPAHAMYFACYEKVKHHTTIYLNGKNKKNSSLANGLAGASATIFHDIVMNPAEVIKQRMQMYKSKHKTPIQCISATLRTEGIRAFYRSFPTQLLMNIPFQTVHFVVYEYTQEMINTDRTYNPISHVLSGAAAGACAAFVTNPLDVCRTLLNTQEFNHNGSQKMLVSGLREALVTVFRTDGLRTFFRGVTARVLYQMPSTAISWSVYELFKHLLYAQSKQNKVDNESSITHPSSHPRDISFQTTPVCASPTRSGAVMTTSAIQYKEA
ncbi:mitoferrin-1-like [Styela clava]|uniref:mitoferrin-1-like n=1 Tax=Styela clava TaxID=7725 RepID=UPI001939BE93|nr:mitoferrin-1-like [Styela clava]